MSFSVQYGEHVTRVVDSGEHGLQLHLALPSLGGAVVEHWPLGDAGSEAHWQCRGDWYVLEAGDVLWACAVTDAADAVLEQASEALYEGLFTLVIGWQLQRVWHYLPRINEPGSEGLERYRAFCRGRSLAFEKAFGEDFHTRLPAASALGCEGDKLVMYACARRNAMVHYLENPLQIPAYRYSQTYGPRAPGFARASVTEVPAEAGALREIYLSGTASIREECSLLEGGILGQLDVTVGNLNRIAAEAGLEDFLSAAHSAAEASVPAETAGAQLRRFKVYVRHAEDYAVVRSAFNALLRPGDDVLYVRSDVCRAELDIEIEATVVVRIA